jgi:hypothetical protein
MKIINRTLLAATIGLFALPLSPLRALADKPNMEEALEQLEKARKSEHPVEHLEIAKRHLEDAVHNKHGERAEALHQVFEAINAARKDEHHNMEEHIGFAIMEIREGKHEHH